MSNNTAIRRAVHHALMTGAVAAAGTAIPMSVQAQEEGAAALEEVVVTGSRIRRVDAATASPVFTYDSDAIQKSGVNTIGELVTQLPSVSGAATNPQVNNGGGNGDTNIELRGLDPARTLVLLNGRRVGPIGYNTGAVDVNMIPVNMIDRVEVLKEGAGAIYGSDAIAGVVNFITKQPADGADLDYQYGITGEDDGESHSLGLSFGMTGDKGGLMIGANYNKQEQVSAGDRGFSENALYLYNPAVYGIIVGGSSRTPNGRISIPAAQFNGPLGCSVNSAGNIDVTRIEGTTGASSADYRCYQGSDAYNYQPLNLALTPQERGSVFTVANYAINDYLEVYTELLYTHTSSGYQIAPLPFDARSDDIVISADSIYNPFGVDIGGIDAVNGNGLWRLLALGNRQNKVKTDASQVNLGLRGSILDSNWDWDVGVNYGRTDQDRQYSGYLFTPSLAAAFGPSFIDTNTGQPTCGTLAEPINGCIPVNIFNLTAPGQAEALSTISAPYTDSYSYQAKGATANITGSIIDLPAGALQLAAGYEYRELLGIFNTDYNSTLIPPLYLTCLLSSEACSASSRGAYDVSEFYAEALVPLLKDLPLVSSLNLTLGVRYSDYSTFGDTTNGLVKLEYRPVDDLLLRGSYAEVFRAPTIYNLSHGPAKDAPTFNDPCVGLTSAALAANPNLAAACVNVAPDTDFEQPNAQVDGIWLSNGDLDPETGDVLTVGLVYDPSWLSGLSLSLDFWQYKLDDLITRLDPNFTADQCVASGDPIYCDLIQRNADGTVLVIREPYVNLGSLETSGYDVGASYLLSGTAIGDFQFSLEATYIDKYDVATIPGVPPTEIAGTYDRQFGNYAQWRGVAGVSWGMAGFDALLKARYLDSLVLHDADGQPGIQPDLQVGSTTYLDLTVGYTLPTETRVQLAVINMNDKQPPILYQNNVINSNTDVQTYDTIGRRFMFSISQKF